MLRRWSPRLALLALLGLFLGLALATYRDYGVTLDEGLHRSYSQGLAAYYLSLGRWDAVAQDPGPAAGDQSNTYGTLFDLPFGLWEHFQDLGLRDYYRAKHLYNAFWGLAALVAAAGLAWRLGGPWAGFLAALFLFLTPRFYGHSFNNLKDVPFAATFTLALWAAAAALDRLGRGRPLPWLRLGLAWAAVFLVRFNGLAALAIGAGGLGLFSLGRLINRRLGPAGGGRPWEENLYRFGLGLATVYVLAFLLWPLLQQKPLDFFRILSQTMTLVRSDGIATVFQGRGALIPWYYLPVWLFVGLPPVLLGGAAVGLAAVAVRFGRALRDWLRLQWRRGYRPQADDRVEELATWAMLLVWVLGLPAYLMVTRFPFYDGLRLFLFIVPGLAVLAGLGVKALLDWLGRVRPKVRWALVGLLCLGLLEPAWAAVRLHPLQVVYFSPAIGGLRGAEGRFDLDYWAGSTRLACRWLEGYTRGLKGPLVVKLADPVDAQAAEFGPQIKPVVRLRTEGQPGDFYVSFRRWGLEEFYPQAPVIHYVSRDGVALAFVKQLRPVAGLPWPPREVVP